MLQLVYRLATSLHVANTSCWQVMRFLCVYAIWAAIFVTWYAGWSGQSLAVVELCCILLLLLNRFIYYFFRELLPVGKSSWKLVVWRVVQELKIQRLPAHDVTVIISATLKMCYEHFHPAILPYPSILKVISSPFYACAKRFQSNAEEISPSIRALAYTRKNAQLVFACWQAWAWLSWPSLNSIQTWTTLLEPSW